MAKNENQNSITAGFDRLVSNVGNAVNKVTNLELNQVDKVIDLATSIGTIGENPLASSLGVTTTNDNITQFFNRFGTDSAIQEKLLTTVIQRPYYFNNSWSFVPNESKVKQIFKNSTKERDTQAMKYFIQGIQIPDFDSFAPEGPKDTYFGPASQTGIYIKPTSNEFTVDFLSTEFSLHEHVFYYWLRETTADRWQYDERPFSKCILRIAFFDSDKRKRLFDYVLKNVYPIAIETLSPSHSSSEKITRTVTFAFDCMYVNSADKRTQGRLERAFDEYIGDKLKRKVTTGLNKTLDGIRENIPFL
jgi:hypothetical protein